MISLFQFCPSTSRLGKTIDWKISDPLKFHTFSANGEVSYEAKVPDTITSWIASAFAVNDATGLGVAPITSKVEF